MDKTFTDEYAKYSMRYNRNTDDYNEFVSMLAKKYPVDRSSELDFNSVMNDDELQEYREILTIQHECDEYFLYHTKRVLKDINDSIEKRTKTKEDNR